MLTPNKLKIYRRKYMKQKPDEDILREWVYYRFAGGMLSFRAFCGMNAEHMSIALAEMV